MRSAHIWIISGMAGALIGAAATYYVTGNHPPASLPASVDQSAALSRDQAKDTPVASSDKPAQDAMAAYRDWQPKSGTKTEPPAGTPSGAAEAKKPDPAEEEAMVQIVTSRLYDPTMTLPGIMQSEEMLKLSEEARERVVAKMVQMLNRGEIDAHAFMPAGK